MNETFTNIFKSNPVHKNVTDMVKGNIADVFNYGSGMKFNKTGKQIKAALEARKPIIEAQLKAKQSQLPVYQQQCGDCIPSRDVDSYLLRGCQDRIISLPKMYNWDQIRPQQNGNDIKEVSQSSNCMELYNECVREIVGLAVDLCYIQSMTQLLEDGKSYELSMEQANTLLVKSVDDENDLEKGGVGSGRHKMNGLPMTHSFKKKLEDPKYMRGSDPEEWSDQMLSDSMDKYFQKEKNKQHFDSKIAKEVRDEWHRRNAIAGHVYNLQQKDKEGKGDIKKSEAYNILLGDQEEQIEKAIVDELEKGGKPAVIGEVRVFGGKNYKKTDKGWRLVGKGGEKKKDPIDKLKEKHNKEIAAQKDASKSGFSSPAVQKAYKNVKEWVNDMHKSRKWDPNTKEGIEKLLHQITKNQSHHNQAMVDAYAIVRKELNKKLKELGHSSKGKETELSKQLGEKPGAGLKNYLKEKLNLQSDTNFKGRVKGSFKGKRLNIKSSINGIDVRHEDNEGQENFHKYLISQFDEMFGEKGKSDGTVTNYIGKNTTYRNGVHIHSFTEAAYTGTIVRFPSSFNNVEKSVQNDFQSAYETLGVE